MLVQALKPENAANPSMAIFSELATAAYCPRKLYYERREDDRSVPEDLQAKRALAEQYPTLLDSSPAELQEQPIDCEPAAYRARLHLLRDRSPARWQALTDPMECDVIVEGQDCTGRIGKIVDLEGPVPVVRSAGSPPETGVWSPDSVRAVAAARALSWREGEEVDDAIVEYPAHAVVRDISLTVRRLGEYRRVLRTVESLDGPPGRVDNESKCESCEFKEECGTPTRSLWSLLS